MEASRSGQKRTIADSATEQHQWAFRWAEFWHLHAVTMVCSVNNASEPMLVRICEDRVALGTTITCSFFGSAVTQELTASGSTQFTFTCPTARDATDVGGLYSIMTAPFVSDGTTQAVTCTVL